MLLGLGHAVSSHVAPFTGAWIEIISSFRCIYEYNVAPFTGAWIEISNSVTSLLRNLVAPFTGAWIEIPV